MGLLKAAGGAIEGVFADQWREFFYCDSMDSDVLVKKGCRRISGRSSNTEGSDNVISDGSVIAVADGQCMMIVQQGEVVEFTAEPGEFLFDTSKEPSVFTGNLGESLLRTFATMGRRFTFGGEVPHDQRIYYFNTKELMGNKYGTATPVPFRVVDRNIGLDLDISVRCFGEYSFRISDPMLFYRNVCGNVTEDYTREELASQMKAEVQMALQPAFSRISEMGIRYSSVPGHTAELTEALSRELSVKWGKRGLAVVSFAESSISAGKEDEDMIKQLQHNAVLRSPDLAAAHLVSAQAEAMKAAASNEAGAMTGFLGMGMAGAMTGGTNVSDLYRQSAQQPKAPAAPAAAAPDSWMCSCGARVSGRFCPNCGAKKPEPKPAAERWICACGHANTGKFCTECGARRPEAPRGWTCSCGAVNQGRFCSECGARKPAGVPQYRCDKCGWEPADPAHPPRFCPECGDPFGDEDLKQ